MTAAAGVVSTRPAHLLDIGSVRKVDVERWMTRADELRAMAPATRRQILAGAVVCTLFYEPSTRTRLSFESAVLRLGGQVVGAENALENSSAKKGEALEDVFRVVATYADAIVIRHHEADAMSAAAPYSRVPVINAGAGAGEHPTQALLDVYTIFRELNRVDNINVCVMGDLRYGRTVHSLLKLLAKFSGVQVTLLHPPLLGLPTDLMKHLEAQGVTVTVETDVQTAFANADVVYQTRVQKERLASLSEAAGCDQLRITQESICWLQKHACILHPLPRVDEITPEVDEDPRAAYFRQVENGLYMRMALLQEFIQESLKDTRH